MVIGHLWGLGLQWRRVWNKDFKWKIFGKKRIADTAKRKLLSKENSRFQAKLLFFMSVISPSSLMETCSIYSQSLCWFMGIQPCHSPPPCMLLSQWSFFSTIKSWGNFDFSESSGLQYKIFLYIMSLNPFLTFLFSSANDKINFIFLYLRPPIK